MIKLKITTSIIGDCVTFKRNNPGNLRPLPSGQAWKGQVGVVNGYVDFSDLFHGLRAMAIDIYGDWKKRGKRTLLALIAEYAPPNENDTERYITNMVYWLRDPPLDGSEIVMASESAELDLSTKESLAALLLAQIRMEHGKRLPAEEALKAAEAAIAYVNGATVTKKLGIIALLSAGMLALSACAGIGPALIIGAEIAAKLAVPAAVTYIAVSDASEQIDAEDDAKEKMKAGIQAYCEAVGVRKIDRAAMEDLLMMAGYQDANQLSRVLAEAGKNTCLAEDIIDGAAK